MLELLCESRLSYNKWVLVCESTVLWALYVLNSHITATVAGSDWSESKTVRQERKKKRIRAGEPLCCDELMSCLCACVYVRSRPCSVLDGDVEEHYTTAIPLGPFHAEGHSCGVTWNMVQSALYDQSLPSLSSFRVVWRARRFSALAFLFFGQLARVFLLKPVPSPNETCPPLSSLLFFPISTSQPHRWEQRWKCYVIMSVLVLFLNIDMIMYSLVEILLWICPRTP